MEAFIIVDVWDKHWLKEVEIRTKNLAFKINKFLDLIRMKNNIIIHSPSDTMRFYRYHLPRIKARLIHFQTGLMRKLFFDNIKYNYQTKEYFNEIICKFPFKWEDPEKYSIVWKKQSDIIKIDKNNDFISANEIEIFNILNFYNIKKLNFLGTASNGCILFRPFGILNMMESGVETSLIGDLSDCLYDERYISKAKTYSEANVIVNNYINSNICKVKSSKEFI